MRSEQSRADQSSLKAYQSTTISSPSRLFSLPFYSPSKKPTGKEDRRIRGKIGEVEKREKRKRRKMVKSQEREEEKAEKQNAGQRTVGSLEGKGESGKEGKKGRWRQASREKGKAGRREEGERAGGKRGKGEKEGSRLVKRRRMGTAKSCENTRLLASSSGRRMPCRGLAYSTRPRSRRNL